MKSNAIEYNCLFGGGAVRGAAYTGAIKALEEIGVTPVSITGSSVGAIVATLLALGYDAKELQEVFLDVNFELFRDIQFGIRKKFALSKGELFLKWIRELIEKKYYGDKYKKGHNNPVCFKDIEKKLIIITTDISNFAPQEFSKSETPDFEIALAVRISCSMPGLMKSIEYNGKNLVDGDLLKSIPMWETAKSLKNTNTRMLEFRLEGNTYDGEQNPIQFMNTVYTCMTTTSTNFIRKLYNKKDMFDCISINTGDVILVDFNCSKEKREEIAEYGYKQTMKYFTEYLLNKKLKLADEYTQIDNYLKNILHLINQRQILKSKNLLNEMFVNLCDYQDNLDKNITDKLKDFHKLFSENIKYPALFGIVKLKDSDKVIDNLAEIKVKIENKIFDLKTYIEHISFDKKVCLK